MRDKDKGGGVEIGCRDRYIRQLRLSVFLFTFLSFSSTCNECALCSIKAVYLCKLLIKSVFIYE